LSLLWCWYVVVVVVVLVVVVVVVLLLLSYFSFFLCGSHSSVSPQCANATHRQWPCRADDSGGIGAK